MSMIRYEAEFGYVSAETEEAAAALAAEYRMGRIKGVAPDKKTSTKKGWKWEPGDLSVERAVAIFASSQDSPRPWPSTALQRKADAVIAANPGCTDFLY